MFMLPSILRKNNEDVPTRQSYTKDMPPEALLHQSCEAILSPSQSHIIEILSSEEYPLGTRACRKSFKYSADVVIQDNRKGKKKFKSSRYPDDWDEDDVREFWRSRDKKVQSSDVDVNPALMLAREKFIRKKGKQHRGSTLNLQSVDTNVDSTLKDLIEVSESLQSRVGSPGLSQRSDAYGKGGGSSGSSTASGASTGKKEKKDKKDKKKKDKAGLPDYDVEPGPEDSRSKRKDSRGSKLKKQPDAEKETDTSQTEGATKAAKHKHAAGIDNQRSSKSPKLPGQTKRTGSETDQLRMKLSWQVMSFHAAKGSGTVLSKHINKLDDMCKSTIRRLQERNADLGKMANWYTGRWDEMGTAEAGITLEEWQRDHETDPKALLDSREILADRSTPTPYERTTISKLSARDGIESLDGSRKGSLNLPSRAESEDTTLRKVTSKTKKKRSDLTMDEKLEKSQTERLMDSKMAMKKLKSRMRPNDESFKIDSSWSKEMIQDGSTYESGFLGRLTAPTTTDKVKDMVSITEFAGKSIGTTVHSVRKLDKKKGFDRLAGSGSDDLTKVKKSRTLGEDSMELIRGSSAEYRGHDSKTSQEDVLDADGKKSKKPRDDSVRFLDGVVYIDDGETYVQERVKFVDGVVYIEDGRAFKEDRVRFIDGVVYIDTALEDEDEQEIEDEGEGRTGKKRGLKKRRRSQTKEIDEYEAQPSEEMDDRRKKKKDKSRKDRKAGEQESQKKDSLESRESEVEGEEEARKEKKSQRKKGKGKKYQVRESLEESEVVEKKRQKGRTWQELVEERDEPDLNETTQEVKSELMGRQSVIVARLQLLQEEKQLYDDDDEDEDDDELMPGKITRVIRQGKKLKKPMTKRQKVLMTKEKASILPHITISTVQGEQAEDEVERKLSITSTFDETEAAAGEEEAELETSLQEDDLMEIEETIRRISRVKYDITSNLFDAIRRESYAEGVEDFLRPKAKTSALLEAAQKTLAKTIKSQQTLMGNITKEKAEGAGEIFERAFEDDFMYTTTIDARKDSTAVRRLTKNEIALNEIAFTKMYKRESKLFDDLSVKSDSTADLTTLSLGTTIQSGFASIRSSKVEKFKKVHTTKSLVERLKTDPRIQMEKRKKSILKQASVERAKRLRHFAGWDAGKELPAHKMDRLPTIADMSKDILKMIKKKQDRIEAMGCSKTAEEFPIQPDLEGRLYASKFGLEELFEFLLFNLIFKKPDRPIDYLIEMTRKIMNQMKIRFDAYRIMQVEKIRAESTFASRMEEGYEGEGESEDSQDGSAVQSSGSESSSASASSTQSPKDSSSSSSSSSEDGDENQSNIYSTREQESSMVSSSEFRDANEEIVGVVAGAADGSQRQSSFKTLSEKAVLYSNQGTEDLETPDSRPELCVDFTSRFGPGLDSISVKLSSNSIGANLNCQHVDAADVNPAETKHTDPERRLADTMRNHADTDLVPTDTDFNLSDTKPNSTDTKPNPTDTTPNPTDTKPNLSDTKPNPTDTKPYPTDSKPNPTDSKLNPTDTNTNPINTNPNPTDTKPNPKDTDPNPKDKSNEPTESNTSNIQPGATDLNSTETDRQTRISEEQLKQH